MEKMDERADDFSDSSRRLRHFYENTKADILSVRLGYPAAEYAVFAYAAYSRAQRSGMRLWRGVEFQLGERWKVLLVKKKRWRETISLQNHLFLLLG
jgi:hypothetical protein